jgi:CRISP-associated protein Cas1
VKHAVSVTLLNWRGNILGQFLPQEPISNELKIAQYESFIRRDSHLNITRAIIETKLKRQKEFLESLKENYPSIEIPSLPSLSKYSEDFMRNQEARYAIDYFAQFGKACEELGHDFRGGGAKCNIHANDLPNALLNYGYSLLQTYVQRALNSVGLDNSLPFVHELRPNTGLVYDLMELWRINSDY